LKKVIAMDSATEPTPDAMKGYGLASPEGELCALKAPSL